jgi:hypothetical protein
VLRTDDGQRRLFPTATTNRGRDVGRRNIPTLSHIESTGGIEELFRPRTIGCRGLDLGIGGFGSSPSRTNPFLAKGSRTPSAGARRHRLPGLPRCRPGWRAPATRLSRPSQHSHQGRCGADWACARGGAREWLGRRAVFPRGSLQRLGITPSGCRLHHFLCRGDRSYWKPCPRCCGRCNGASPCPSTSRHRSDFGTHRDSPLLVSAHVVGTSTMKVLESPGSHVRVR